MADEDLITPKADAAPSPEASDAPEVSLPSELVRIPAMQALMVGKPAAASVLQSDAKSALFKDIFKHKDDLLNAGFALYRSLDGNTGVLFNQFYLHPEEIKAADQAGQLLQIAPPLHDLNGKVGKMGKDEHPIATHDGVVPGGLKPAPVPSVPQLGGAVAPPPAAAQRKALAAKIAGLQPGSPTSGPSPGAGRIANVLQKPVV